MNFYDKKIIIAISVCIIVVMMIYYFIFYKKAEKFANNQSIINPTLNQLVAKTKMTNDITAILKFLKIISDFRDNIKNATDSETLMLRTKASLIVDLINGTSLSPTNLNKLTSSPTLQQQILTTINNNKNNILSYLLMYNNGIDAIETQIKQLIS